MEERVANAAVTSTTILFGIINEHYPVIFYINISYIGLHLSGNQFIVVIPVELKSLDLFRRGQKQHNFAIWCCTNLFNMILRLVEALAL